MTFVRCFIFDPETEGWFTADDSYQLEYVERFEVRSDGFDAHMVSGQIVNAARGGPDVDAARSLLGTILGGCKVDTWPNLHTPGAAFDTDFDVPDDLRGL